MNHSPSSRRVVVFCGAASGVAPVYLDAATRFGAAVAARGLGLIYGGHHAGMMGAVAEGCLRAGGSVTGILPDELVGKEVPPEGIELVRVPDMHTRKAMMVALADVVVALPGGYGTLDELFEQLTWRAIGKHQKPIGVLDVVDDGVSYWAPLVGFIEHAWRVGFIRDAGRSLLHVDADVDRLLAELTAR
jgi:uncharacterized protein (TIGR00730 family)